MTKDIDRKGWWQLVAFVGVIALLAIGAVITVLVLLLN
jgi:uncharacterized membrane protein YhaH (DUF805 family)